MREPNTLDTGQSVLIGVLSAAAGTAAMDLLLYARYRRDGGKDSVWNWESGEAVHGWEEASAPGQVGQKLEKVLTHRTPPDSWARTTTNVVHWATGVGWGVQYGLLAGQASRRRWIFGLSLGPAAWLSSYAILPLVKVYKPIWDYDARTLAKDLSAHVVYGVVTWAAFATLSRSIRPGGTTAI